MILEADPKLQLETDLQLEMELQLRSRDHLKVDTAQARAISLQETSK